MNDYILRPLATSQLLREATPEAAFRMMTEGIVYTQLVQVCTTLDQAVFALINGSVVFDFPGKGKMVSYFAATEEKRSVSAPPTRPMTNWGAAQMSARVPAARASPVVARSTSGKTTLATELPSSEQAQESR